MILRQVLILGLLLSLVSCARHISVVKPVLKEKPKATVTNLSETLSCVRKNWQGSPAGVLFLVDEIHDGTVRPRSVNDGALSDAGRQELINALVEYFPPTDAIVLANTPPILLSLDELAYNGYGGALFRTGTNEYGLPDAQKVMNMKKYYLQQLNQRRKLSGLPEFSFLRIVKISGSYTSFDSDSPFSRDGDAAKAGNSGHDASVEVGVGRSQESKSLSLVINLTNIENNFIAASNSLTLSFYKTGAEYNFAIRGAGSKEGSFGFTKEKTIIEGTHSAQKTLIDAMALWIVYQMIRDSRNPKVDDMMEMCVKEGETSIFFGPTLEVEKMSAAAAGKVKKEKEKKKKER